MANKILKYFELPIEEVKQWTWKEYLMFVVESCYTTVFPFIAGMLLVERQEVVWIFMLILPIYFRLTVLKKFTGKVNRRLFMK